MYYRTAPLLCPPFLRPTSKKKRGEGVTRTCAFASQLSPPHPTNLRTEINEALLWGGRRELLRSTCAVAVLKATYVAIFWQVSLVSQPDSSHRLQRLDDGLRKPSEISEKSQDQFSNYFLHAWYTVSSTLATHVHVQELQHRKPARAARRGGRVMEVK